MNQEFKLPVEQTLKRLKGLDNYPVVSRFLQNPENRGRAKTLILEGTNQLVDRFNSFSENTHVFPPYMFRAQMLRETLPNNTLPLLEEIAIATYANAQITAGSQEPVLLPIVASPNALDSSGGLGWRSAEGIRAFKRRFAEYE